MMFGGDRLQDTVMIFLAIITEAVPFVLIGVLVSAFLTHFVKKEKLLRFMPANRFGAMLWAMGLGFFFPVCECGNVPVARKLLQKGLKPFVVITFLLAAPVLNPLVLFATWSAFRFMPEIFYLRIVFTFLIAFMLGLIMSFHPEPERLLAKKMNTTAEHEHEMIDQKWKIKIIAFLKTASREFFEMFGILIVGALLASALQLLIPRTVLLTLGNGPVLSVFTMIVFAVITAVCSNVDAFIALSYVNTFTPGSLLAFLTFGPLLDLKSILMIRTIFNWRSIIIIFGSALLLTMIFTLSYNFYAG